jgi:hypothetical protein
MKDVVVALLHLKPAQSLLPRLEDLQMAINPCLFASPDPSAENVALTAEQKAALRRVGEQLAARLDRSWVSSKKL